MCRISLSLYARSSGIPDKDNQEKWECFLTKTMAFKKDNAAFNHKPREEEIKKKHTDTSMS
jgi:hypothetical protein